MSSRRVCLTLAVAAAAALFVQVRLCSNTLFAEERSPGAGRNRGGRGKVVMKTEENPREFDGDHVSDDDCIRSNRFERSRLRFSFVLEALLRASTRKTVF